MNRVCFAATLALFSFVTSASSAEAECPTGSKQKSENDFTWCEPSVCLTEAQCAPAETCAPYPLCVQVGTTNKGAALADAGQRLIALRRCGPDSECPDTSVCSNVSRCVPKVLVEQSLPAASATTPAPKKTTPDQGGAVSASAEAGAPRKKDALCGCDVPGTASSPYGLAAAVTVALAALARRRIRRDPRTPLG